MGAWEEQAKRTIHRKRLWSEAQEFSFIDALLNATNEEEVKGAYVREFSLLVKTQERHDLVVDKVLFEFKYSVKLGDIEVVAKVVAQAIYYINRLFRKGRLREVEYLVVADKNQARLFRVVDFRLFYESHEYQWDNFRPSSPDPKLVRAIKNSKILESNRIYKLTSQDDLHLFTSRLYKILSLIKTADKPAQKSCKSQDFQKLKTLIFGCGIIFILSLGFFIGCQYYLNYMKQSAPANKKELTR